LIFCASYFLKIICNAGNKKRGKTRKTEKLVRREADKQVSKEKPGKAESRKQRSREIGKTETQGKTEKRRGREAKRHHSGEAEKRRSKETEKWRSKQAENYESKSAGKNSTNCGRYHRCAWDIEPAGENAAKKPVPLLRPAKNYTCTFPWHQPFFFAAPVGLFLYWPVSRCA
jgi:hypothetical protein